MTSIWMYVSLSWGAIKKMRVGAGRGRGGGGGGGGRGDSVGVCVGV